MFATIAHVIEYLGLGPGHVVALILGPVVTWGVTQAVKKDLEWSGRRVTVLAFIVGFIVTYTIAPGWGWQEIWLACAVGLFAPGAYKVLVKYAASRWEWAKDLSGDKPGGDL